MVIKNPVIVFCIGILLSLNFMSVAQTVLSSFKLSHEEILSRYRSAAERDSAAKHTIFKTEVQAVMAGSMTASEERIFLQHLLSAEPPQRNSNEL